MVAGITQALLMGLAPFTYIALGRGFFSLVCYSAKLLSSASFSSAKIDSKVPFFVLGLLVQLLLCMLFRSLGLSWLLSATIPYLLVLRGTIKEISSVIRSERIFSINFLLWFVVVFALGISLFKVRGEISTPWVNNYGDLAFHLGMITSFVFGDNFPPEYHIFPGLRLSYPFLANLWTAVLWAPNPTWISLPLVFALQWLVVWIVAYYSLNGDRIRLAPWAVLLGGGSYSFVVRCVTHQLSIDQCEAGAHSLIGAGYPWTPFITTVWVTQRPALFGLCIFLPVLQIIHRALFRQADNEERFRSELLLAGLILGLSPLVHSHFLLVVVLYILLLLAGVGVVGIFRSQSERYSALAHLVKRLATFSLPLFLSFAFLPWLLGKSSIIKLKLGWMPWPNDPAGPWWDVLLRTASMWLNNAPHWFLFVCLLVVSSRRLWPPFVMILLFVLFNGTQIAVWEWDQIKCFVAIYLISVSFLQTFESGKVPWYFSIALICLIVPGGYEVGKVMEKLNSYTVYSKADVELADAIREKTAPSSVILAKPDHNSPITLTGRRMFVGYDGTLHSHAIDYQQRYDQASDLAQMARCKETAVKEKQSRVCPDYLLWTGREQAYYRRSFPEEDGLVFALNPFLYRFE